MSSSAAPDLLALLRQTAPPPPAELWPEPRPCARCETGDIPEADAICGRCYDEVRGVIPFDAEERRERTAALYAGRACPGCRGSSWRTSLRGDIAVCIACERAGRLA